MPQSHEFKQLIACDESGPEYLLQQRDIPRVANLDRAFLVTHVMLPSLGRQPLAAALLAQRTAGPKAEVQVVEDLRGFVHLTSVYRVIRA